jgi:hypothetical protein
MELIDLTGQNFGRWTVIERAPNNNSTNHTQWLCECSCDAHTRRVVSGGSLRNGRSKSCCGKSFANLRHGHCRGDKRSPTLDSFHAMHDRTGNPNATGFSYYGGRGVRVCDRWCGPHGFENFLADMGPRPKGTTLDRYPHRHGNYEPSNCRWATYREQAWNMDRTTKHPGIQYRRNKFEVHFCAEGKKFYLGRFETLHEAEQMYRAAVVKYDGVQTIAA